MLRCLLQQARQAGRRFRATFRGTDRNRMMQVTYRFAGFREGAWGGDAALPESALNHVRPALEHPNVAFPGRIS